MVLWTTLERARLSRLGKKSKVHFCLNQSQREQGSLSLRTTPERTRFTLLRKRLNGTLLQQLKSEAPKQTSNSAEHQFSEQGSVSRPTFTFLCLGKVENRRACAAKFTFLYQVFLELTSLWGARGSVRLTRFEVHFTLMEKVKKEVQSALKTQYSNSIVYARPPKRARLIP